MKTKYIYRYYQIATGIWTYTENYKVAVSLSTEYGKFIGQKIEKLLITKTDKK